MDETRATLPPIPDEAWLVFGHGDTCDLEGELWPILYAAALRHAADTVDASDESDTDWVTANGSFWRGRYAATVRLRRMADGAATR